MNADNLQNADTDPNHSQEKSAAIAGGKRAYTFHN
jgi:hypothetical protein